MAGPRRELVLIDGGATLRPAPEPICDAEEVDWWTQRLSELSDSPRGRFPGTNPVSLERMHFDDLRENRFVASLKMDGVRYALMLSTDKAGEPAAIMVDRALRMYEIEVWANPIFFERGTLLDGELVRDFGCETQSLSFLVFDALVVSGARCSASYSDRLQRISQLVMNAAEFRGMDLESVVMEEDRVCAMNNALDLKLVPKKFVPANSLSRLWEERKHSPFRHDGVILTRDANKVGRSATGYKWKLDHTVDVVAEYKNGNWAVMVGGAKCGGMLDISDGIALSYPTTAGDARPRKRRMRVEFAQNELVQCLLSEGNTGPLLVECAVQILEPASDVRFFAIKLRNDKNSPNHLYVLQKTLLNIEENIGASEMVRMVSAGASQL